MFAVNNNHDYGVININIIMTLLYYHSIILILYTNIHSRCVYNINKRVDGGKKKKRKFLISNRFVRFCLRTSIDVLCYRSDYCEIKLLMYGFFFFYIT